MARSTSIWSLIIISAVLVPSLAACAAAEAAPLPTGGGRRLLSGRAPQPQQPAGGHKPLGYVPSGCTLASVKVDAYYTYKYAFIGPRVIRGTVTLSNGNAFAVPVPPGGVKVTLAPAVPVSPFILTANCGGSTSVAANPQPYAYGTLTCSFESPNLPTEGPAAGFGGWKNAFARVTLGMSGATCESAVTPIRGWILTDIFGATPPSPSRGGGIGAIGSAGPSVGAAAPTASRPATATTAASTATALLGAARPSGASPRRLGENLGYVPPSNDCQGLTIAAAAAATQSGTITGTVFISNPQQYAVPLASVRVQINNNVPVAPMFVDAVCPSGMSVPANPVPFQLGTLACTFTAQVPAEGPAADTSAWTSVMPKVTIAMSNAACGGAPSPIAQAPQPSGPILYGR